jgi:hypothetical protein
MLVQFTCATASVRQSVTHVLKPVRLGNAVEELVVGVMLGTMVMGTEVMIVEP